MLYREIIAVCSEIHTKHINTLCGLKVDLLNLTAEGTYFSTASKLLSMYSKHHWTKEYDTV